MCQENKKGKENEESKVDVTSDGIIGDRRKMLKDDYDDISENMRNLRRNMGSIAGSLFNITSEYFNEFNKAAKGYTMSWLPDDEKLFETMDAKITAFNRDILDRRFFRDQSLAQDKESSENGGDRTGDIEPWLFGGGRSFGEFFGECRRKGRTPFDFFAFKGPSLRQYNECIDKSGEQVWDSDGYWRCLFPNAEVRKNVLEMKEKYFPDRIFTKEDFNSAVTECLKKEEDGVIDLGNKGVFFRQYTDFLKWKSQSIEKQGEVRHPWRDRRKWRHLKHHSQLPSSDQQEQPPVVPDQVSENLAPSPAPLETKFASSRTSEVNVYTEGERVIYKEVDTEYFDDGTSKTTTITKTRPRDNLDWQDVSQNVSTNNMDSDDSVGSKSGWFWNSSDN